MIGFALWMLTIVFIGLKVSGQIDWSWDWVLSPVLIPLGIAAPALLLAALDNATRKQVRDRG